MARRTNYSFQELFNIGKDKVNESNDSKPTFWGIGSVSGAIFKSVAFLAEWLQLQLNIIVESFRVKSATGLHLRRRVEDYNLTPNSATNTEVLITFTGTDDRVGDIIIPEGTIVQTEPDVFNNFLEYELIEDTTLPLSEDTITGTVVCTQQGSIGNIGANTITVLPTPITGIESITNLDDATNGTDEETDEQLRSRLPNHLQGLQTGNIASIKAKAYSVSGITYVNIAENHPEDGNFTVYISNETGIVDDTTINNVASSIDTVTDICVTYTIVVPDVIDIDIEFDTLLDSDSYNSENVILLMKQEIYSFINKTRRNKIYISDIINVAKDVIGVINIKNVLINNINDDLELEDFEVAKIQELSDITVNLI